MTNISAWLYTVLYSLAGAAIWYGFYCLSARARIRKAKKEVRRPELLSLRIIYLVTGIISQILYWCMVVGLAKFAESGGMK